MITGQMWRGIVMNGLYQIAILIVVLFEGDKIFGCKNFADIPEIEF